MGIVLNQKMKGGLAGGFFLGALGLLVYSVFGGAAEPTARTEAKLPPGLVPNEVLARNAPNGEPPTRGTATVQPAGFPDSVIGQMVALELPKGRAVSLATDMRNLFAYKPPDPLPPPPPPPPPTINLYFANPTNIYARTNQPFDLVVQGTPFREGMQIYFDGAQLPSKLVAPNELRATVTPGMFSSAHTAQIAVKDPSNPQEFFSSNLNFQIQEPPKPNVQYIGWVAEKGGHNPGALLIMSGRNGEERNVVREGEIIDGRFKVTEIRIDQISLMDTKLSGIQYNLPMQGQTGSPGGMAQQSAMPASNNPYPNYTQTEVAGEVPAQQTRPYTPPNGQEIRGQRINGEGRELTREELIRRRDEVLRNGRSNKVNQ